MKIKNTLLLIAFAAISLNACKKDSPETTTPEEPDFEQISKYVKKYKNGVVEVTQLPGDTVTRRSLFYFNFDKAAIVAADKVKTNEWDVLIKNGGTSVIQSNNGTTGTEEDPWFGNTTTGMLGNILSNFDAVQTVPSTLVFNNSTVVGTADSKTDVSTANPVYWAYYVQNVDGASTHLIPFTDRTTIFKLTDGRYVKFQMINTYNNTPDKNSATSKFGFYSFRYFVGKAGSTDIKTN